jgi:hypothetical protein
LIFNSWGQPFGKFVKPLQLGFDCVSARSAPGIGSARISGARDWKRCGFMVSEVRGNEYKVTFFKAAP